MPSSSATKRRAAQVSTWTSVAINFCLALLQLITGILVKSQALIADAVHTFSDLVSDFVVLLTCRFSDVAPDWDHQYGHYRYETLASLFLGVILLVVAGITLWRGIENIVYNQYNGTVHYSALLVAFFVVITKECLFRFMLRQAKRVKSNLLVANAWHARSDAASSLVVACGIAGNMIGYPIFDPLAACIVGLIIGRMGVHFGWNALQDLSDRALPPKQLAHLKETLETTPGVRAAHRIKTRKTGDWVLVDAYIVVDPKISVSEGHFVAELARNRLRETNQILDAVVHVDPEYELEFKNGHLPCREVIQNKVYTLFNNADWKINRIEIHYLLQATTVELFCEIELSKLFKQSINRLFDEAEVKALAQKIGVDAIKIFFDIKK